MNIQIFICYSFATSVHAVTLNTTQLNVNTLRSSLFGPWGSKLFFYHQTVFNIHDGHFSLLLCFLASVMPQSSSNNSSIKFFKTFYMLAGWCIWMKSWSFLLFWAPIENIFTQFCSAFRRITCMLNWRNSPSLGIRYLTRVCKWICTSSLCYSSGLVPGLNSFPGVFKLSFAIYLFFCLWWRLLRYPLQRVPILGTGLLRWKLPL